MWAWIISLLKNNLLKILGVIADILVVIFIGYSVYVTAIKPHTNPTPTSSQKADTITNNYYYPNRRVGSIGVSLPFGDFGWVKYSYPEKPTSTETITGAKK